MKIACVSEKTLRGRPGRFIESSDWICHDLLIAKLHTYGFDQNALKFSYDSFCERSQKAKLSFLFRVCLDIIYGIRLGSIIRHKLSNLDICCLFFEDCSSDFANFADDITPYECGPTLHEVMNNL